MFNFTPFLYFSRTIAFQSEREIGMHQKVWGKIFLVDVIEKLLDSIG